MVAATTWVAGIKTVTSGAPQGHCRAIICQRRGKGVRLISAPSRTRAGRAAQAPPAALQPPQRHSVLGEQGSPGTGIWDCGSCELHATWHVEEVEGEGADPGKGPSPAMLFKSKMV